MRFLPIPRYAGTTPTLKRRLNFNLVRFQRLHAHEHVVGYPFVLTIDPINACNLRCPHCLTGMGHKGRPVSRFPLALLERLLDELGDYLLQVEFGNWGDPILDRDLPALVRAVAARGIGTTVATHLNVPLDDTRARALVDSGLTILGVALDGAHQGSHEQYRVGGDFAMVLDNIRRIQRAKAEIGRATPRVVWSYHVFAHNRDEIEEARAKAAALGADFGFSKGFVIGDDWDPGGEFPFYFESRPGHPVEPCHFLWERAVVAPDGGIASCVAGFLAADDFGTMDGSFRRVWNGERFRAARRLYRARARGATCVGCAGCPQTLMYADYRAHRASGAGVESFRPRFTSHDGWNFVVAHALRKQSAGHEEAHARS